MIIRAKTGSKASFPGRWTADTCCSKPFESTYILAYTLNNLLFNYFVKLLWPVGWLAIAAVLWVQSCAQIGSPSGGPRDTIPPKVIRTEPQNRSSHFDATKIEIEFNEYYQIKNRQNAVMVSPPMNENPKLVEKGHTIELRLQDTLRSNTTYTFDFGKNIVDLNEGNPLGEFQYVVSTGETLDSLRIQGYVVDAFSHEPLEEIEVYLYKENTDSLPRTRLPFYWAQTNKQGWFSVNNIAKGSYKVFALKDANRNHIYDVQNETIAFLDSLVVPSIEKRPGIDTTKGDSSSMRARYRFMPDSIHLRVFQESQEKQYLESSQRPLPGKCLFVFNKILDSLTIEPVNFPDSAWAIQELTLPNDSIIFWLRDTSLIYTDSLTFNLTYLTRDSLGQLIDLQEEVSQVYDTTQKKPSPKIKVNLNAQGQLNPRKQVQVHTQTPVRTYDTSRIALFKIKDSLEIPHEFNVRKDTTRLRRYRIASNYKPETQYKLKLFPGAFTGWYGNTHDTVSTKFSYIPEEEFGNLKIVVSGLRTPGLFQFMKDGNDQPLRQKYIQKDTTIRLEYIQPGKYRFRLIADANGNRKWDPGNYEKYRQPEFVHYFNQVVNVKAGWDNKLQWQLERSIRRRKTSK